MSSLLELKVYNPKQPRYPMGHPLGGQFMDAGDTSLWLSGKPLKGGHSSTAVLDPNTNSTASPAATTGGAGGASRFTNHADPKVQAAAALISFPANYPYPRAFGAPPAIVLKQRGKPIKVVSLRRGDVVDRGGVNWTVVDAKKSSRAGFVDLTLVDDQGNVDVATFTPQHTLPAVARTPHPTAVAQAKRDVTAAARAMAVTGAPKPAAPAAPSPAMAPHPRVPPTPVRNAPAPAAPTPPPPAPAAPTGGKPINVPPPPPGWGIYAHPQGKHIYVDPYARQMQVWKPDGKPGTSSATPAKLANGHGSWVSVSKPLTDTSQHPHVGSGKASRAGAAASARAPYLSQPLAPPARSVPVGSPRPPTPNLPPPAPAPAPSVPATAGSPRAGAVLARGPQSVTVDQGWTTTGGAGGSNAAAMMRDPSGTEHYVKFQDAEHADNEVTAGLFYEATGVKTPTIRRAAIAPGVGASTEGIASERVQVTNDMLARMGRDATYRDKVLTDFATHAWLANWDAVENDNTATGPNGDPITIDVGGSLAFRARGGPRRLDDTVKELRSMRDVTAGGTARRAFAQLTPDHTDQRFVAGVERIAGITPAQIRQMLDAGMPSMSARKRGDIAVQLVKRRAHLARVAGVTLPEDRVSVNPPAAPNVPAAPTPAAPAVPTPTPAASSSAVAAAQAILTPPPNYPYGVVPGAPVASTLPAPKSIKLASLRKGDVIQTQVGAIVTIESIRGTHITGVNDTGQSVTFAAGGNTALAVARTPHPTVVANARRQLAAAPAAGAPAAPNAAPTVVQTTPSHTAGRQAAAVVRGAGSPSPNGYAPVAGQTYATATSGDVLVVHSDGSGTRYTPTANAPYQSSRNVTPAVVDTLLQPGTVFRPIGPQPHTPTANHPVGRHSNAVGDVLDVYPDGSGQLTLANGSVAPMTEAAVDQLLNPPASVLAPNRFGFDGPSPHHSRQNNPTTGGLAPAPTASSPYVGQVAPSGGWGSAGQIAPGAVFVNANGDTLSVGPRGGGKMTFASGAPARNMSAVALASNLNRRGNQWKLQTTSPSALVANAPTVPSSTPAGTPSVPRPAGPTPAAGPTFAPRAGQAAATFNGTQPGQVFRNTRSGSTMTIGTDYKGTFQQPGKPGSVKSPAQVARQMQSAGWVAVSGPDIDTPGREHARAVRQAARGASLPPAGTPLQGIPPAGAVYPSAATGGTTSTPLANVARGQTVRHNGDDWVITEVVGGKSLWGYRPGKDDPNTITQEATGSKVWHQGVELTGLGKTVDAVGPAPQPAINVPSTAKARDYDPALGTATTTPAVGGAGNGAPFDVNSQLINADQLKAGDAILVNGHESRGLFVVTKVDNDHKGRAAVYGYAASEADAADAVTPGSGDRTETKLFLVSPSGTMRQSRVQVNGATPALPEIPRPRPPLVGAADIERNDISDATSKARVLQILSGSPSALSTLPTITNIGDKALGHLMELRGYNAHPDVVTDDEMDSFVDDGEIELWRGMTHTSTVDVAEEYRSGRHYPGGASGTMYGAGTYAAYGQHRNGQRDAIRFVTDHYAAGYRGQGVMVRMTIKADARVVEHDALKSAFASDRSPEASALRNLGIARDAMLGHYAVLCGYDVIRKSNGYQGSNGAAKKDDWSDGFLVIVNRSAMRISEKNYVPDSQVNSAKPGASPPPKPFSQARHRMNSPQAKHDASVDYQVVKDP